MSYVLYFVDVFVMTASKKETNLNLNLEELKEDSLSIAYIPMSLHQKRSNSKTEYSSKFRILIAGQSV